MSIFKTNVRIEFWVFFIGFGLVVAIFGLYLGRDRDPSAFIDLEENIPPRAQEILTFWFGDLSEPIKIDKLRMQLWHKPGPATKAEIKKRYEEDIDKAYRGLYLSWRQYEYGSLALVLLLDQFPRMLYPGDAKAFAYSRLTQRIVDQAIELKQDQRLRPVEQVFLYQPYMHAESLALQNESLKRYEELKNILPKKQQSWFMPILIKARENRNVIFQYGRFPERNDILNRSQTTAEVKFLEENPERLEAVNE